MPVMDVIGLLRTKCRADGNSGGTTTAGLDTTINQLAGGLHIGQRVVRPVAGPSPARARHDFFGQQRIR